ncbi:MAG: carbohydrate-binding domain-containing protein [Clostridia bacterium]|nr:carbohydrate-binding domain-containing protein [Clostridia bacterium]
MLKQHMKTLLALAMALLLTLGTLSACTITWESGKDGESSADTAAYTGTDAAALAKAQTDGCEDLENLAIDTYIELGDADTTVNGSGTAFENGTLTITKAGTYSIKGTLSDGQIVVNTGDEDKVKLLLDGVSVHSETSAPILILSSPKETKLLLAAGSENTLSDKAGRAAAEDEDPTAVIYSKDDLEISGTGTLNIEANYNKGIFSKDDLQISGGTLNITAADDALRGKDSLTIAGGVLNLTADGDGIRTSNEEKGALTVSGGVITVNSALDGLQAAGELTVSGGVLNVTTGGGFNESMAKSGEMRGSFEGGFGSRGNRENSEAENAQNAAENTSAVKEMSVTATTDAQNTQSSTTISAKGIKADGAISISGGTLTLNCLDDAIHGNAAVTVSGGTLDIRTNDDGIHADTDLTVSGGAITIAQSYEGLEGNTVTVSEGTVDLTASDDGINAAPVDSQSDTDFFANFFDKGTQDNAAADDSGNPPELPAGDEMTPPTGENGNAPEPPANGTMTPPTGETGAQQGGFGGRMGGGRGGFERRAQNGDNANGENANGGFGGGMGYDDSAIISISGGRLTVNAGGDGLDSNGDIKMTGGSLTVYGPTNSGNSALDYAGAFDMTGGTLLAVGAAGMAQSISSGLASIATACSISEGDKVELQTAGGNTLKSFTAPKTIGHVVYADETLKSGETYSIVVNGSEAGEAVAK